MGSQKESQNNLIFSGFFKEYVRFSLQDSHLGCDTPQPGYITMCMGARAPLVARPGAWLHIYYHLSLSIFVSLTLINDSINQKLFFKQKIKNK